MQNDKLDNYLRTYRKKLGLTQREVAFLLGCHSGAKVSRYERSARIPLLTSSWLTKSSSRSPHGNSLLEFTTAPSARRCAICACS